MMTGGARPPVRDQSSRRAGRGGKFAKAKPGAARQGNAAGPSAKAMAGAWPAIRSLIQKSAPPSFPVGGAARERVTIRGSLSKDGDPRGFTFPRSGKR